MIDADTSASGDSYEAALRAAGSGLDAIERLRRRRGRGRLLGGSPAGSPCVIGKGDGFLLVQQRGGGGGGAGRSGRAGPHRRFDAHHGNGTQDIFYSTPRSATSRCTSTPSIQVRGCRETGSAVGLGPPSTCPCPRARRRRYRAAFDTVIEPVAERFDPPGCSSRPASTGTGTIRSPISVSRSGDFADLTCVRCPRTARVAVSPSSKGATTSARWRSRRAHVWPALAGETLRPEPVSGAGPAKGWHPRRLEVVSAARRLHLDEAPGERPGQLPSPPWSPSAFIPCSS